jgi:alpha-ketoglutarate-dependent taurine dioxygenase
VLQASFPEDGAVVSIRIPEQKVFDGIEFPLVLGPNKKMNISEGTSQERLTKWVLASTPKLLDDLLLKHGAILFKGFHIDSPHHFNDIVETFGFENFPYVGGAAVRRQLAPRVFTTNESPPTEKIPFHHEMAQVPSFPDKVFFQCDMPSETGGETPVLPSWEICRRLEALHPEFIRKLEKGVRYIRVMPEEDDPSSAIGRGWKSTYATSDRSKVSNILKSLNYSGEWLPDGSLRTISPVLPAVRHDLGENRSGRKTFFNSVVAVFTGWNDSRNKGETAIEFADGSYLDPSLITVAGRLMEELAVAFPWCRGDFILIDNHTVMHSRRPFTGKRIVTASLAKALRAPFDEFKKGPREEL